MLRPPIHQNETFIVAMLGNQFVNFSIIILCLTSISVHYLRSPFLPPLGQFRTVRGRRRRRPWLNIKTFIWSHCSTLLQRTFTSSKSDSSCLVWVRSSCWPFANKPVEHLSCTGCSRSRLATQLRRPLSSFFLSTFHTFGFRCIQLVSALSFAPINFHLASAVCEYEGVGGEETHYAVTLIIISAFRVTFNYAKYFLCSFKRALSGGAAGDVLKRSLAVITV